MSRQVIEAIAGTPGVCRYVDIPLQHSEDALLRSMRRPANGGRYLEQIRALRDASPDIAIRTTFIVGFPGETEERFADLLRFVEQAEFDRVGVFEYSDERGAASSSLPGKVPPAVIARRKDRLMRLQQPISLGRNRAWIGREIDVLVEGMAAPSGRTRRTEARRSATPTALGRSHRDAPEIDGSVVLTGPGARPGEFVTARVTDADVYDLVASVTAERGNLPPGAEALAGSASR
jgi:ribosomal protein S12 methylthiotransferase